MQNRTERSLALLSAPIVVAVWFSATAQAQMTPGNPTDPNMMVQHAQSIAPHMTTPSVVPPPVLPGASSRGDNVAPATRAPTDMSPNDALFDAINRGDIAVARDAMNRGADLGARNILDMTPMELSVDLGRNDISFMLLSYRGSDSSQGASGQAQASLGPPAGASAPAPGRKGRAKTAQAGAKSAAHVQAVADRVAAPPAQQAPRLFANDGGSPVPGAGFLGFDAAQSGR